MRIENINDYLKDLLIVNKNFSPSLYLSKLIQKEDIAGAIYNILANSKNIISGMSEDQRRGVLSSISSAVQKHKPIKLFSAFGSYKKYNIESSPHINWAEVFYLNFILDIMLKVGRIYPPGIIYNLDIQDLFINKMNNIPKTSIDVYFSEFNSLTKMFVDQLPNNVILNIERYSQCFDKDEFKKKINSYLETNNLNVSAKHLESARANYVSSGNCDSSTVFESARYNRAYFKATMDLRYQDIEGILLIHRRPGFSTGTVLPMRTYRSSVVQFWVGEGAFIVHKEGDNFRESILSSKQVENYNKKRQLRLDIPKIENFPSLNYINIYG